MAISPGDKVVWPSMMGDVNIRIKENSNVFIIVYLLRIAKCIKNNYKYLYQIDQINWFFSICSPTSELSKSA